MFCLLYLLTCLQQRLFSLARHGEQCPDFFGCIYIYIYILYIYTTKYIYIYTYIHMYAGCNLYTGVVQ